MSTYRDSDYFLSDGEGDWEVRPMETEKGSGSDPQGERARRPYERPRVAWEEDFEPYVYKTCGKKPGGGGACVSNPYSG